MFHLPLVYLLLVIVVAHVARDALPGLRAVPVVTRVAGAGRATAAGGGGARAARRGRRAPGAPRRSSAASSRRAGCRGRTRSSKGWRTAQKCHEQGQQGHGREVPRAATSRSRSALRAQTGVHRDVTADCVDLPRRARRRRRRTAAVRHEAVRSRRRDRFRARRQARAARRRLRGLPQDAVVPDRSARPARPATPTCTRARSARTARRATRRRRAFKDVSAAGSITRKAGVPAGRARIATVACESCHVNKRLQGRQVRLVHRLPSRSRIGRRSGRRARRAIPNDTWRTTNVRPRANDVSARRPPRRRWTARRATSSRPMKVKPQADTCAACHVDVHRGTFKQDCKACHSESGFEKAPFDHAKTTFALTGKHAALACVACHKTRSSTCRRGPPSAPARRRLQGAEDDLRELPRRRASRRARDGLRVVPLVRRPSRSTATCTRDPPEFFAGQHAPVACDQVPRARSAGRGRCAPARRRSRVTLQERLDGVRDLPPGRAPRPGRHGVRDVPHASDREVRGGRLLAREDRVRA